MHESTRLSPVFSEEVRRGRYVNYFLVSSNPSNVVVDCGYIGPETPQAKEFMVQSRLIMHPQDAKALIDALSRQMEQMEKGKK